MGVRTGERRKTGINQACFRNISSGLLEGTKSKRVKKMRLAGRQECRHIGPCRPKKEDLYFILRQEFLIVSVPWTSWAIY